MAKLNWMTKACGVFLLWVGAAGALPGQTLTTLHSFDGTDGAAPIAGLVQGTNGSFYGTTEIGGAINEEAGTIFSITTSGTLTTLLSFDYTDGGTPMAGLVQGTNGDFYGTTYYGGTHGEGTVFSITSTGTVTTLHSFFGTVGFNPNASLVQGANGGFYGTTYHGGANSHSCTLDAQPGCGTVFSITANGTLKVLHSFDGADGEYPGYGALVQGTDGMFYGTTEIGGANGDGTVFTITPSGTLTTLHSFDGTDGSNPSAGLVLGTNGAFYGTTFNGGANDYGTVFSITASGTLTTLHSFEGTDGAAPIAGLVQGTDGEFYGTTEAGGVNDDGTVFSLSVGLGQFVETLPASGVVGAAVTILGTNLTGATSVTFNGTAAVFMMKSGSEITTTVPTGATTGKVQVIVPRGTLSSSFPFRVRS